MTKAFLETPQSNPKMPRKARPTPIAAQTIESEPPPAKEDEETKSVLNSGPKTKATSPAESVENSESGDNTENADNGTEDTTDAVTRRPRKKIRRPVISDTIPAVPVAAFSRLVREITQDCNSDIRWEADALKALQTDTEAYLIGKFQNAKKTLDLFGKSGRTVGENMLRA
jgi:histone H3/H4